MTGHKSSILITRVAFCFFALLLGSSHGEVRRIYYGGWQFIERLTLEGPDAPLRISGLDENVRQLEVSPAAGFIYWSHHRGHFREIFRADIDGRGIELIIPDSTFSEFALDRNRDHVYFFRSNTIVRKDMSDGSETVLINTTPGTGLQFDHVNDKIYWSDGTSIKRADRDGTSIETIVNASDRRFEIDPISNVLYYLDLSTAPTGLRRVDLTGSLETTVWSGANGSPSIRFEIDPHTGLFYYDRGSTYHVGPFGTTTPQALSIRSGYSIGLDFGNPNDLLPPAVTISSPVDGFTTDTEFVTLLGEASDDILLERLGWEQNGEYQGIVDVATDGSFSIPNIELSFGANVIRVTAEDSGGNLTTDEITVNWSPLRRFHLGPSIAVSEGDQFSIPIQLQSNGTVGGGTFEISYDPDYVMNPEIHFSDLIGTQASFLLAPGSLLGTFSRGSENIPSSEQLIATFTGRARSVPELTNTPIGLNILDVSDYTGNPIVIGTSVSAPLSLSIAPREYSGDINTNRLLDIGDAFLMQQLVLRIEEPRAWDQPLNDLNGNSVIDAGDVTSVLRTIVGLEPQPSGETLSPEADGPFVALEVDNQVPAPGTEIHVSLALHGLTPSFQGASLTLDYDVEAMKLKNATSHVLGDLVAEGPLAIWNVAPSVHDYDAQTGSVSFAAARQAGSTSPASGVLAELTFVVQPGVSTQPAWPITVRSVHVSNENGFNLQAAEDSTLLIAGQAQTFANWLVEYFSADEISTGVVTAWAADVDDDGQSNGQEYMQGSNPLIANEALVEAVQFSGAGSKVRPSVRLRRSVNAIDAGYLLMRSTDMETWNAVSPLHHQTMSNPVTGTEDMVIGPDDDLNVLHRVFLRVEFDREP